MPKGWHYRGYLPHYDGGERRWQFVTLHLGDSLPLGVVERWRHEFKLAEIGDDEKKRQLRIKIERRLDAGYGACFLRQKAIAELAQNALLHFHAVRYNLAAWVVMPNHIHFLLKPLAGFELSAILHSLKSFSANRANHALGKSGQFWQEDYFDRYIRDQAHFDRTVRYIENNPVNAKLCAKPNEWHFSSARFK